jgi:(2Fe-2S) ferredoxin
VKVSYVSCLGMCGEGPNVLVCSGGKLFKHCTGRESAEIVGEARGHLGRTDP